MPDLVKSVPIVLDKPRLIRLDFNALMLFQDTTGVNPLTIGKSLTPRNVVTLLWASLRDEDPELTLKEVGRMIGMSNALLVENKLVEAFTAGMPERGPEDNTSSPQM